MLDVVNSDVRLRFEQIIGSVQAKLDVPIVHATLIGDVQQEIVFGAGPLAAGPDVQTLPIAYAICRHTVAMQHPLVVDDAFTHPLLSCELAVTELRVAAYLGAPLRYMNYQHRGALCAIDVRKRRWSKKDIVIVMEAAKQIIQLHE